MELRMPSLPPNRVNGAFITVRFCNEPIATSRSDDEYI